MRFALALIGLATLAIAAGPSPDTDSSQPEGVRFSVHCQKTGEGGGAVTCALVVSGLPDPLEHEVSVFLFQGQGSPETPHGSATANTGVASEAPTPTAGPPLLVGSQLALAQQLLLSTALSVPAPPPRSL